MHDKSESTESNDHEISKEMFEEFLSIQEKLEEIYNDSKMFLNRLPKGLQFEKERSKAYWFGALAGIVGQGTLPYPIASFVSDMGSCIEDDENEEEEKVDES